MLSHEFTSFYVYLIKKKETFVNFFLFNLILRNVNYGLE